MCDTDNSALLSASVDLGAIPENIYDIDCDGIEANVQSPTNPTVATMLSATSPGSANASMHLPAAAQHLHHHQQQALLDDIASENYWLREKMKEVAADRDRLLCEVANLRLELDMVELKRLPEDR